MIKVDNKPFWRFILSAWYDLLQGRDRLLIGIYCQMAAQRGVTLPQTASLPEVREHYVATVGDQPQFAETMLNLEPKMVRAERLRALWLVGWTSILPALLLLLIWTTFLLPRFHALLNPQVVSVSFTDPIFVGIYVLPLTAVGFYLFSFIGFMVQGLLVRPVYTLLYRLKILSLQE